MRPGRAILGATVRMILAALLALIGAVGVPRLIAGKHVYLALSFAILVVLAAVALFFLRGKRYSGASLWAAASLGMGAATVFDLGSHSGAIWVFIHGAFSALCGVVAVAELTKHRGE